MGLSLLATESVSGAMGNTRKTMKENKIEKDVFDILLRGTQPLIIMLARGMKKRWPKEIKNALEQDRLLIMSAFDKTVTRITRETAIKKKQNNA